MQTTGVDHGATGEQRLQDVVDVNLELGDVGAGQATQLLDVTDTVEQSQERTKPRTIVDDRAGRGAHLEAMGVATEQGSAGSQGRPQDHRPSVTGGRPADEPSVHTQT